MTNSTREQTPRRVSGDEWRAALLRKDPSELTALVEQNVAWATQDPGNRCFLREGNSQEHAIVFMPDEEARAPGHVYSRPGVTEARRSHSCEWCYDRMTADPASLTEQEAKGE